MLQGTGLCHFRVPFYEILWIYGYGFSGYLMISGFMGMMFHGRSFEGYTFFTFF